MRKLFILTWMMVFGLLASTTLAQTITPTPSPEDEEFGISIDELNFVLEAVEGQEIDPPVTIELPEEWLSGNGTALVQDVFGLQLVPFTVYTGPVTDGDGFIIVLWGYESTGTTNPLTGQTNVTPYLDALRLLRFAIIGGDCVPGVDVEREFEIGGMTARGANFSAYRCEETVDTRGWFVGMQVDGVNIGFYIFTEPIDAMDGNAPEELQAILDTVEFDIPDLRLRLRERQLELQAIATETALTGTPPPTATEQP